MSNRYSIYTHTSPSGKVYVGQSVNIKKRWGYNGEHYKTKKKDGTFVQRTFARAIIKYGWENFIHEIILENISKEEADYAEKYLIKWYKLHNQSYNNSIVHEAEHIKQAMLRTYEVEDEGEAPAYTIGYLVSQMWHVFKEMVCGDALYLSD